MPGADLAPIVGPLVFAPLGGMLGSFVGPVVWLYRRGEFTDHELWLVGAAGVLGIVSPLASACYLRGELISALALLGAVAILLLVGSPRLAFIGRARRSALAYGVTVVVALALLVGSRGDLEEEHARMQELPAVTRYFAPEELDLFHEGAALEAILEALSYRGNFYCAYRDAGGREVTIIAFSVEHDLASREALEQRTMWAVFVDRRFEKFVAPVWGEMEGHERPGPPASGLGRLTVDESLARARKAVEARRLSTREIRADYFPWRSASASSKVAFLSPILGRARSWPAVEANARLRETFNGARVELGRAREALERRFGPPHACATEGGRTVCAYGSGESFELSDSLHHESVVVVYGDGHVAAVFGYGFAGMLGAGDGGR